MILSAGGTSGCLQVMKVEAPHQSRLEDSHREAPLPPDPNPTDGPGNPPRFCRDESCSLDKGCPTQEWDTLSFSRIRAVDAQSKTLVEVTGVGPGTFPDAARLFVRFPTVTAVSECCAQLARRALAESTSLLLDYRVDEDVKGPKDADRLPLPIEQPDPIEVVGCAIPD